MVGGGRSTRGSVSKSKVKIKKPSTKGTAKGKGKAKEVKLSTHDVYEDDSDNEAAEVLATSRKFDRDGQEDYTFKLPDQFDDEDIDSDDAFNSEDEQKYEDAFAGIDTKKTRKIKLKKSPSADNDNSEDEEKEAEFDEDDDDEFMDLSEMLHAGAEDDDNNDSNGTTQVDFSDDDDDNDDADPNDSDAEEKEEERHGRLVDSISAIANSSKRKRKAQTEVVDEVLEENEFNVLGTPTSVGIDSLLGALKSSAAFGNLKTKVAKLEKKNLKLEKPASDREIREATRVVAYSKAKDEITKWAPVVKARRELEHLSFPLNQEGSAVVASNADLTTKFNPTTDMEKTIASMLNDPEAKQASGDQLTTTEELEMSSLSQTEKNQRIKELRKLRSMESLYASKCKRIKKIKSKKYHKIKNKELKKVMEKVGMDELKNMDPEQAAQAIAQAERDRALNRASLRHKNTSKWAKHLLSRKQLDSDSRKALAHSNSIDQDLRRKITLTNSDDDDSDSDAMPNDIDEAMEEVNKLRQQLEAPEAEKKGLYNLKFMQNALAKKKAVAQESLDELDAELSGTKQEIAESNIGRRKFGKSSRHNNATTTNPAPFAADDEWGDDNSGNNETNNTDTQGAASKITKVATAVTVKVSNPAAFESNSTTNSTTTNDDDNNAKMKIGSAGDYKGRDTATDQDVEDAANPWLSTNQSVAGLTPQIVMDKFTKKSEKRERKLQRDRGQPSALNKKSDVVVDLVQVDTEAYTNVSNKKLTNTSTSSTKGGATQTDSQSSKASDGSFALSDSAEQKALIEQAFAGDNIVTEEFEAEKASLVDKETNKDEDVTLPGWGNWGGFGVKKEPKRRFIKKAAPQAPRKDGKLKHVIITERKDKKFEKKMVENLPFPYTNRQQFERDIRQPVGKEWNTAQTTQALTKPKIETKAGKIIEPMTMTKSIKKSSKAHKEKKAAGGNKKKTK